MIEFLQNHFRYNTMNSWNQSTSYAIKMKIYDFVPKKLQDKAFEMLEVEEVWDDINDIIRDWEEEYNYQWQVGFNGRSSGYLVLYQGGMEKTDYKTRCDTCGILTWYEKAGKCKVDGCDGKLIKLTEPHKQKTTTPGKSTDMNAEFEEWEEYALEERVKLVKDFDELGKDLQKTFISYCKNCDKKGGWRIEDEEYFVSKTRKVLKDC